MKDGSTRNRSFVLCDGGLNILNSGTVTSEQLADNCLLKRYQAKFISYNYNLSFLKSFNTQRPHPLKYKSYKASCSKITTEAIPLACWNWTAPSNIYGRMPSLDSSVQYDEHHSKFNACKQGKTESVDDFITYCGYGELHNETELPSIVTYLRRCNLCLPSH